MKKIICALIIVIVVAICTLIGVNIYKNSDLYDSNDTESRYREEGWLQGEFTAYFLREKLPTDIIWYGEYHYYEDFELPVRFETEINDEVLQMRDGYEKVIIFINDLDENLNLSEDDYKLILRYMENNSRYNFMYVGHKDIKTIYELFGFDSSNLNEDTWSIEFLNVNGYLQATHGPLETEHLEVPEFIGFLPLDTYVDMFDDE